MRDFEVFKAMKVQVVVIFTLKLEAARPSEMLVSSRVTKRCHTSDVLDLNFHHREDLISDRDHLSLFCNELM